MARLILVAGLVMEVSASVGAAPETGGRIVRLWFADGGMPPSSGLCGGKLPPAFTCASGGSREDCQRAVAHQLQALYDAAGVDVKVSLRPADAAHEGSALNVIVTSADAGWCKPEEAGRMHGLAPINCDGDGKWGTTAYVFSCDGDAKLCAVRIAQEVGHLVGLDHTNDPHDVMYSFERRNARFVDRTIPTVGPRCGRAEQNSYRLIRARLGRKPGTVTEPR